MPSLGVGTHPIPSVCVCVGAWAWGWMRAAPWLLSTAHNLRAGRTVPSRLGSSQPGKSLRCWSCSVLSSPSSPVVRSPSTTAPRRRPSGSSSRTLARARCRARLGATRNHYLFHSKCTKPQSAPGPCKVWLIVLDDIWVSDHERMLNFLDPTELGSAVFVTTRFSKLLQGYTEVPLGMLTGVVLGCSTRV